MAGKIIHCGAAGAGQAAKVCNNMVLAVHQIAIGEAFVLAEKLGLSAQSLFDVITGATGNCWAVHTNCPVPGPVPTSPANNDFKPGFATALMNKDLGLAMDAVNSTGSAAPLGSHAAEIYAKFAADHADKDFSAVIETPRAEPGLTAWRNTVGRREYSIIEVWTTCRLGVTCIRVSPGRTVAICATFKPAMDDLVKGDEMRIVRGHRLRLRGLRSRLGWSRI